MKSENKTAPETSPVNLWTITDETTLSNAIKVEKVRHATEIPKEQYKSLDNSLHKALEKQDSELALALITR